MPCSFYKSLHKLSFLISDVGAGSLNWKEQSTRFNVLPLLLDNRPKHSQSTSISLPCSIEKNCACKNCCWKWSIINEGKWACKYTLLKSSASLCSGALYLDTTWCRMVHAEHVITQPCEWQPITNLLSGYYGTQIKCCPYFIAAKVAYIIIHLIREIKFTAAKYEY